MTSEWRDIASAPRDGTFFLAHYSAPHGPRVGVMQFWPASKDPVSGKPIPERFHSWTTLTQTHFATHWMKLPEPPGPTPPSDKAGAA